MAYAPPGWAAPTPYQSPPQRRERVLLRFGNAWSFTWLHLDLGLITLWFIVTAAQFRHDELLLYPLALYFTGMFFWRKDITWPVFQRGVLIVLLPSWLIASTLWSPEPTLAFRSGLQSLLTILICMYVAARLTPGQLVAVILAAMTVMALRCLPQGLLDFSLGKPSKALYSHKNSLGAAMSILFLIALATVISARTWPPVRLLGLAALPLGLFLVFASKSATAILISIGMAGILLGALVYLGPRGRIGAGRMMLIAATIAIAAIVAALALNFLHDDPVDLVLRALGKDRSLTGRTDLWSIGLDQIAQNPFAGVGAHGYWRYDDSPVVRQIFVDYHKDWYSTFYFHNSWLEIGVHYGLIGLAFAAAAMIWAQLTLLRRALRVGGAVHWAMFAVAVAILIRTFTESDLFNAFNMLHMLLWSNALNRARGAG